MFSAARTAAPFLRRFSHVSSLPRLPKRLKRLGLLPEKVLALENQYYRRLLEAVPSALLLHLDAVPAAIQHLEQIAEAKQTLETPENDAVVRCLLEQLPSMNREEVLRTLQLMAALTEDESVSQNTAQVWSLLDSILVRDHKRADRSSRQLLSSLDHALLLCKASPGRTPNFAFNLCGSIVKRLASLDLEQCSLLKLLFCLNLARNPIPASAALQLQQLVLRFIDDMSVEEVGLVAAAFFKTQTKLTNAELIVKIVGKVREKSLRFPDKQIAVSSIFKVLKQQCIPETVACVRDFIDSFAAVSAELLAKTAGHCMSVCHQVFFIS